MVELIKEKSDNKELIYKFKQNLKRKKPDFNKALKVYKNIRIFMKISYSAWRQGITVKELLLR